MNSSIMRVLSCWSNPAPSKSRFLHDKLKQGLLSTTISSRAQGYASTVQFGTSTTRTIGSSNPFLRTSNTNTSTSTLLKRNLSIKKSSSGSSINGNTKYSSRKEFEETERLIVVGSGVAGCSAALIAAERHKVPVTLLYAGSLPTDCNSYWAQGGIIYRNYDPQAKDSAASLVQDVHRAGAGLCIDEAVWKLANDGPARVRELLLDDSRNGRFANVPFDRNDDGSLSCCLEASHAAPRIIHYADHTGKAITEHITAAALNHPLISVIPETIVTDLAISQTFDGRDICIGAHIMNKHTNVRHTLFSTVGTLLASGGLGGIFQHSTNPSGFNALGSSAALALRANANTCDLEYVQFHPTALYIPNQPRFLLTEALRGEGAILRDASGRAFAKDFHPDGELAPRDVVARGVFFESQKSHDSHNVFLDITHRDPKWLKERFPSIDVYLHNRGLDITKNPLPITPAAHYTCGGITTDLHGRTNILGLYSAGEAARTGLHGGNRLASTSLLEGLVYGAAVADFVGKGGDEGLHVRELAKETLSLSNPAAVTTAAHENTYRNLQNFHMASNMEETMRDMQGATELLYKLRRIMWDYVGVQRTKSGLITAVSLLGDIKEEACHLFDKSPMMETAGLKDAAFAGEAVAKAALNNPVSAGAHHVVLDVNEDEDEDSEDEAPAALGVSC